MLTHQQPALIQQPIAPVEQSTAEKPFDRPEVRQECSEEDWSAFLIEWEHYKRSHKVTDARASDSLYQCCEPSLRRLLIREDPGVLSKSETDVKEAIKQLAVIKKPISIRRTTLLPSRNMVNLSENSTRMSKPQHLHVISQWRALMHVVQKKPTRLNTQLVSSRTYYNCWDCRSRY